MSWTQGDSDRLADIIWWIKGRVSADRYEDFDESHIEALRKARADLDWQIKQAKDGAA